jgi:60 kDa SS-A/Ro ribonucleoprotein
MARQQFLKNRAATPQSQPLAGKAMVKNAAGGYAFEASNWMQLDRFICIGTAGGNYYASESALNRDALPIVEACLAEDGVRVVNRIVGVRKRGLAYKQDAALFVFALALAKGDAATKSAARAAFGTVAKTAGQLYAVAAYADEVRGWGETLRHPIAHWFLGKPVEDVVFQTLKYGQRDGFSARDLVRMSHPKPTTTEQSALFKYLVTGAVGEGGFAGGDVAYAVERVRAIAKAAQESVGKITAEQEAEIVSLIRVRSLTHEMIPTEVRTPKVWSALLEKMPVRATVWNLATLTRLGVLTPMSDETVMVVQRLRNAEMVRNANVHPLGLLTALKTYASGRSLEKGAKPGSYAPKTRHTWTPVPQIVDALTDAFHGSLTQATPSGKRLLFGLDLSGSMKDQMVSGVEGMSAAEAAGAMLLVMAASEDRYQIVGYNDREVKVPNLTAGMRLDTATEAIRKASGGSTDCSVPIKVALERKIPVDAFLIFTDGQGWGSMAGHVCEWLERYRAAMGIDARCVLLSASMNSTTLADPQNPNFLDIVGFSPDAMAIAMDFCAGRIA